MSAPLPPDAPTPPPPHRLDMARELASIRARVDALEASFMVHDDRLDVHDMKFQSIEESLRELRARVHQMQGDVFRLADAATSSALTAEKQAKSLFLQHKSLELIAGNVQEVLTRLQPKVVL